MTYETKWREQQYCSWGVTEGTHHMFADELYRNHKAWPRYIVVQLLGFTRKVMLHVRRKGLILDPATRMLHNSTISYCCNFTYHLERSADLLYGFTFFSAQPISFFRSSSNVAEKLLIGVPDIKSSNQLYRNETATRYLLL